MVFLSELNGMKTWVTDIGNAYLEAYTKESVYIIAGPEFAELEGHTLLIIKALYGLRSSGLRWHERLAGCLREMKFRLCRGLNDVWMRKVGNRYEYIGVYVDDLVIVSKKPTGIIDILEREYKFKLKGTGSIAFHLGCDFYRDQHGILVQAPKKYIQKMIDTYERMYGEKPSHKYSSPLEHNDHPELDTTEFLDVDMKAKYLSIIGSLQWAISIGRIDITVAVMTLSSF